MATAVTSTEPGVMDNAGGARLAPVSADERIGLLDALRGLALAGIFIVNIEWFSRPWQGFGNGMAQGLAGVDHVGAWLVHVFVSGKFWVLFSLLFGIGFALMMERAQASGRSSRLYLRRLAVLFALGIAHALLAWVGDILHTYAIAALGLLLMRGLSPRAQLATGLAIYLGLYALSLLAGLAMMAVAPQQAELQPLLAEAARSGDAAAVVYAGGGFAEVTAQRISDFSMLLANAFGVVALALAVFLVGSWLFRTGRITDVAGNRRFFLRLAAWCLPLGLASTLAGAVVSTGHPDGFLNPRWVFASSLHGLGALPMTLGGVAVLALVWQGATGKRLLGVLAPAGRMALTNYLLQSVIASLVFYGYGLALWGRVGHAGMVLLALVVFAAQVIASRWWLARYRFGPLEWAWRWLTYGRRPPMRNLPAGA